MKNKIKIIVIISILIIGLVIIYLISEIKERNKEKEQLELQFNEITYNVPSEFEYESYYSIKDYSYSDNRVYCNFAVHSYKKEYYDDFEEWFKERITINLNDKISELKQVDINNKKFLNINKENNKEKNYYYGVSSTTYYYFIEYEITDYKNGDREDIDTNKCYNSFDKIISSINVK